MGNSVSLTILWVNSVQWQQVFGWPWPLLGQRQDMTWLVTWRNWENIFHHRDVNHDHESNIMIFPVCHNVALTEICFWNSPKQRNDIHYLQPVNSEHIHLPSFRKNSLNDIEFYCWILTSSHKDPLYHFCITLCCEIYNKIPQKNS